MDLNDEVLVAKTQKGDNEAYTFLVRKYEHMIYNMIYFSVGNADEAMDLSQEVFIKVYRSIKKFRGESSFQRWLVCICKNTCTDYLRKQRRKKEVFFTYNEETGDIWESELSDESVETSPELALEQKDAVEAVRTAISELPAVWRDVIILRDFEGCSYADIAEKLGISEGTVKSRLNRARTAVKNYLAKRNFF